MGFLQRIGLAGSPKIENIEKRQNERERIRTIITEQQLYRETETLKKWREAIAAAESTDTPNRANLMRMYNDAMLDTHVKSTISTRINKVLSSAWEIQDADGNVDYELTEKLDQEWFGRLRRYINEAIYYGYSLVQFGAIINDQFSDVQLVPRPNVIPEFKSVNPSMGNYSKESLISFVDKPYYQWILWIDTLELGLLCNITPHAIWKKNAIGFWGRYQELFGMPVRIGKTDIHDPERRSNMSKMLKDMASAAWATFDKDDTLEFTQSSGSIGNPVYQTMIDMNNSEISKIVLGQTMTTDDGASRSQAEVHERILETYLVADMTFEEQVINGRLLPLMRQHGIFPEGYIFVHPSVRNIEDSVKQAQIIQTLSIAGYDVDEELIEQTTGMKVTKKAPTMTGDNRSVISQVHDLYRNYFKK